MAQNCQKTSEALNILKQIRQRIDTEYNGRMTVTSKMGDNFQQCETRRFLMKTDCNSIRQSWIAIQKNGQFYSGATHQNKQNRLLKIE